MLPSLGILGGWGVLLLETGLSAAGTAHGFDLVHSEEQCGYL